VLFPVSSRSTIRICVILEAPRPWTIATTARLLMAMGDNFGPESRASIQSVSDVEQLGLKHC
jgi:hypothetical protein